MTGLSFVDSDPLSSAGRALMQEHQRTWLGRMLSPGEPGYIRDLYDDRLSSYAQFYDNQHFDLGKTRFLVWPSLKKRLLTEAAWSGPGLDDVWVTYDALSSLRTEISDDARYLRTIAHLLESSFRPYTPVPPRLGQVILIWSTRYCRYFTSMCRGLTSSPGRAGHFHRWHADAIYRTADPWLGLVLVEQAWHGGLS